MRFWHRKRATGTPGPEEGGTPGTLWWRDKRHAPPRTVTVAGGDGAILPLTPEEFRAAKARGQWGVCASESCGRALSGNPWTVETTVDEKPAGTVRVCSENCGRNWIAAQEKRFSRG